MYRSLFNIVTHTASNKHTHSPIYAAQSNFPKPQLNSSLTQVVGPEDKERLAKQNERTKQRGVVGSAEALPESKKVERQQDRLFGFPATSDRGD